MSVLNDRHWLKSYMLEIVKNDGAEVFTFSVPPESEEFTFGQRVTETKTYGGSVFDVYGNEAVKIMLSGSTVNEEKKLIYRGTKDIPSYLTGEEEIWELQKILKKAQDVNNKEELRIYLYDLSKMGDGLSKTLNMLGGDRGVRNSESSKRIKNWWRVYVRDFKIKRDKSKPHTYNYTLELTGIDDMSHDFAKFLKNDLGIVETCNKILNQVESWSTMIEFGIDAASLGINSVVGAVKKVQDTFTRGEWYEKTAHGLNSVTRLISGGNQVDDLYNASQDLWYAVKNMFSWIPDEKEAATEKEKSFRVIFDANGGSSVSPQTRTIGELVKKPKDPTREHCTFAGWYLDNVPYGFVSPVTEDITLTAKWIINTATISYVSNGGTSVPIQYVRIGEKTARPSDPVLAGYVFLGWMVDYALTTEFDFESVPVTDNMVLYAKWAKGVLVSFDSNGGSAVESQLIESGTKAVFPQIPELADHALVWWSDRQDLTEEFNFDTRISADTVLFAKWKQITATLTFESNGGSAVNPVVVTYGDKAVSPRSQKDGYELDKWCVDSALTQEFFFRTTPCTVSRKLYAKWTPKSLSVDFDSNGGSAIKPQKVAYGELAVYPEIPVKNGNTFLWWEYRITLSPEVTTEEGTIPAVYEYKRFDFAAKIKESMTLFARWHEDYNE